MRLIALLVLGVACTGCASAAGDTSDFLQGYADEGARSDQVCSAGENIDEVGEPRAVPR